MGEFLERIRVVQMLRYFVWILNANKGWSETRSIGSVSKVRLNGYLIIVFVTQTQARNILKGVSICTEEVRGKDLDA